jgi:hypothetical protein
MKYYKAVARPTLLYGSEILVNTERDMDGLEGAEMCFIWSVKGCTAIDRIRSVKGLNRDRQNKEC